MNSSRTRSAEIIEIRLVIVDIAVKTSESISKLSWLANRAARIMRSGSSLNDCAALTGVRSTFFTKSSNPPYGSINSGSLPVSSSAIELTVKSRRDKSPSIVSPNSTSGFLEPSSYFSVR